MSRYRTNTLSTSEVKGGEGEVRDDNGLHYVRGWVCIIEFAHGTQVRWGHADYAATGRS